MYSNFNSNLLLNKDNALCEKTYEWFLDDYQKQFNMSDIELKNDIKKILSSLKKIMILSISLYALIIAFIIIIISLVLAANLTKTTNVSLETISYIFVIGFPILIFAYWIISNSWIKKLYVSNEILRFIFYKEKINFKDWFYKSYKLYKKVLSLYIKCA